VSSRGFYHLRLARPAGDFRPAGDARLEEVRGEAVGAVGEEERARIARETLVEIEDGAGLLKELGMEDVKLEWLRQVGRRRVVEMMVGRLADRKITVRQVGRFWRVLAPLFRVSPR
jgi:hypothetical protein